MNDGIVVVVPFFGDDQVRQANLRRVLQHLWDADLAVATSQDRSRSAARNAGARPPFLQQPTLVFNDADTIVPHDQIRKAAAWAATEPGLVYAYDTYYRLEAWESSQLKEGVDPFRLGAAHVLWSPPSAGCVAISRACFDEVGGFDEHYTDWGYEDCDFAGRCQALWPTRRVNGPAWHLWHGERRADDSPLDSDPELVARNRERWQSTA